MTPALSNLPSLMLAADQAAWLSWLPALTMIAGILVLGLFMTMSFNRRERQLRALAAQIASDLEEARALRSQLDDAHALASNMMVSAQRLTARLDERVAALDMASLRMSATRNALPRASAAPATSHLRVRGTESHTSPNPDGMSLSPVLTSIATAMAPSQSPRASVEMKPNVDPLALRVYELADAGQPAIAIARDLNEHVGKVELILALRAR